MARIYIPIEFETNELLKEAMEIKQLANELGDKVYRFRVKASAMEKAPSSLEEEADS